MSGPKNKVELYSEASSLHTVVFILYCPRENVIQSNLAPIALQREIGYSSGNE